MLNSKQTTNQHMRSSGFTLVELMITLAISAILLSVAAPSFSTIIQNNRITTQANQFVAAMTYARSEAIKRGTNVTVTATTGTTDWKNGWNIAAGATTLKVFSALDGTSTLAGPNSTVQYSSNGRASITGTFSLCDGRVGETGRNLNISTTGRISVTDKTDCS